MEIVSGPQVLHVGGTPRRTSTRRSRFVPLFKKKDVDLGVILDVHSDGLPGDGAGPTEAPSAPDQAPVPVTDQIDVPGRIDETGGERALVIDRRELRARRGRDGPRKGEHRRPGPEARRVKEVQMPGARKDEDVELRRRLACRSPGLAPGVAKPAPVRARE